MHLKNIELFLLRPLIYLTLIFSAPYFLGNYLDSVLSLPKIFNYPINLIGLVFIGTGLAIDIHSITTFLRVGKGTPFPWKPPKRLVIRGLYKHTRNPIYVAYFIILSGLAIYTNLLSIFLIAMLFIAGLHLGVVMWEEKQLEKRFGKAYLNYKKEVPRWIPKFK